MEGRSPTSPPPGSNGARSPPAWRLRLRRLRPGDSGSGRLWKPSHVGGCCRGGTRWGGRARGSSPPLPARTALQDIPIVRAPVRPDPVI
jgi:hypothetical protein